MRASRAIRLSRTAHALQPAQFATAVRPGPSSHPPALSAPQLSLLLRISSLWGANSFLLPPGAAAWAGSGWMCRVYLTASLGFLQPFCACTTLLMLTAALRWVLGKDGIGAAATVGYRWRSAHRKWCRRWSALRPGVRSCARKSHPGMQSTRHGSITNAGLLDCQLLQPAAPARGAAAPQRTVAGPRAAVHAAGSRGTGGDCLAGARGAVAGRARGG